MQNPEEMRSPMDPEGAEKLFSLEVLDSLRDPRRADPFQAARLLPRYMNARQRQYDRLALLQEPEAQIFRLGLEPRQPPSVQFLPQARARDLLLAAAYRLPAPQGVLPLSLDESAALFSCFSAQQAREALGPRDPQHPLRLPPEAQKRLADIAVRLLERGAFQACGAAVAAGADIAHAPVNAALQSAMVIGRRAEVIRALTDGGARIVDILSPEPTFGATVAHSIVGSGDLEGFAALRGAGATLNQLMRADFLGETPLDLAATRGNPQCLGALVDAGLDREALAALGSDLVAVVHVAAHHGHAAFVAALGQYLEPGQLMVRGVRGFTAAHYAAESGYPEVLTALKGRGVDPVLIMTPDEEGHTPLHMAVIGADESSSNEEERDVEHEEGAAVIDTLFQMGVPREAALVSYEGDSNVFLQCASDGNLPCLRSLWHPTLAPEAVMARFGPLRSTPAHVASVKNHPGVVKFLSEEAKIPLPLLLAPNAQGNSPIHLACREGHVELIRAWAEAGAGLADFTRLNDARQTPFDLARTNGHQAVIASALEQLGVRQWEMLPLPASPVAGAPHGPAQGPTP